MLQHKSNQDTERAVKYFLAQALGSAVILYFSISLWGNITRNWCLRILSLGLFLKLGAAPCHFWLPAVITSLTWINCLILATWQKLAPLALLTYPLSRWGANHFIPIVASLNAIVGGIIGINQTHIRTILAYSSITHMGWIIGAFITGSNKRPLLYFVLYSIVISPLFIALNHYNIFSINQTSLLSLNSKTLLSLICFLLISLGGLPPLTGFLPKWLVILSISKFNWLLTLILLLGSFINLYFYLNLTFGTLISNLTPSISLKVKKRKHSLILLFLSGTRVLGLLPIIFYAMTLFYQS